MHAVYAADVLSLLLEQGKGKGGCRALPSAMQRGVKLPPAQQSSAADGAAIGDLASHCLQELSVAAATLISQVYLCCKTALQYPCQSLMSPAALLLA
jgi:hypothetical protein